MKNSPDALEAASLNWQQRFDVRRATEDALEIHPASLYVDPHVKQRIDAVQFLLPG